MKPIHLLSLALTAAIAPGVRAAPATPPAPATSAEAACAIHLVERAALPAVPKTGFGEGWTVIAYELDGSGKTLKVRVESSSGNRALDRSMRMSYERSSFAAGVVKQDCCDLLSATKVRL